MKRLGRCFLLLCPLALLAQNGATVEGTVSDKLTHAGLPGVHVALFTEKGANYSATTDSSGAFRIPDVRPGVYSWSYQKPGFDSVELPPIDEPPLRIGLGGNYRLDGEIAKLTVMRGRVLDPEGKPVAGIRVQAASWSVDTDSEGRFTVKVLSSGSYLLRAFAGDSTPPSGQAPRAALVNTWYPSALDEADAQRITVRGGPDLEGLDIHLRRSPVFRLAGVVLDEKEKPIRAASVSLLRPSKGRLLAGILAWAGGVSYLTDLAPEPEGPTAATDDKGHFEFPAVPPGDWLLQAHAQQEHGPASTALLPARVSDQDIANIELRFEPDFPLEVKLDWGDSKPPTQAGPGRVMLFGADGSMPFVGLIPDAATRFDPAQYRFATRFAHVQPGRYRIVPGIGGSPGFYAAAVLVDGRDVSGQDVELTAVSSVSVVYKPNPGSIHGTVEQGEGAHVLMWPSGADIPYLVTAVTAGAQGAFEFRDVPPGTYSVVAFDRIGALAPDSISGLIAKAPQVRVEELSTASVAVPLTRLP